MSLGVQIGLLCAVAAGLAALGVWVALRNRSTPEKLERSRRLALQARGRLGDALLDEVQDNTLYFTYSVRGVQYTASQDVSSLRDRLPEDLDCLIGAAGMKYSPTNPANSILVCEEWSGLRPPPARAGSAGVRATRAASANGTPSTNSNGIGHQAQNSTLA